MPFATVTQCDMCPAVTDDWRKFKKITFANVSPGDDAFQEDAIICPQCAEPLFAFRRSLREKQGGPDTAVARLNERILSALKRTE